MTERAQGPSVSPVIVISDGDNVATALEALEPGRVLERGGGSITVLDPIPRGHKVALTAIDSGGAVIKYGSSIGFATQQIVPGAHVHTHNLSSARGRGDLGANGYQPPVAARLAEPDDRRET